MKKYVSQCNSAAGPQLRPTLKYFNNYLMDYHEIWFHGPQRMNPPDFGDPGPFL